MNVFMEYFLRFEAINVARRERHVYTGLIWDENPGRNIVRLIRLGSALVTILKKLLQVVSRCADDDRQSSLTDLIWE
jgi:hypothetical protein